MTNYQHIAEQMYAAYCQQAGGLTFDGKPLPSFQELGLERQTCWEAAAEAAHKQYAQPQADALDAARYRYLRDVDWRYSGELEAVIRLQANALWDVKIDEAIAAQTRSQGDSA